MNCDGYMAHIGDFCERRLTPETAREVEAHVAACPKCAEFHRMAFEITCREVAEVYEYIENTLPAEKRAVFERHFSICPDCRNYVESYRTTIRLGQEALRPRGDEAREPVSEDFVRSILKRRQQG